jgi:hypothetical protein
MAGMADALRALLGTRDRARRSRLKVPARPALVAGSVLAGLVPLALLLPRHPVPSLATAARPDRPRPRPTITTTSTTTPVVTSSETTLVHGDARWRVGRSGDVVVIGDWDCDRTETPAVLRPATGEVWSFPRWPVGDEPLTGTLVATVPGALGARVVPHDRCDRLTVVDAQGRSTTLL